MKPLMKARSVLLQRTEKARHIGDELLSLSIVQFRFL